MTSDNAAVFAAAVRLRAALDFPGNDPDAAIEAHLALKVLASAPWPVARRAMRSANVPPLLLAIWWHLQGGWGRRVS